MATITHLKTTPHTRIENSVITNMSEIGVYAFAVYWPLNSNGTENRVKGVAGKRTFRSSTMSGEFITGHFLISK